MSHLCLVGTLVVLVAVTLVEVLVAVTLVEMLVAREVLVRVGVACKVFMNVWYGVYRGSVPTRGVHGRGRSGIRRGRVCGGRVRSGVVLSDVRALVALVEVLVARQLLVRVLGARGVLLAREVLSLNVSSMDLARCVDGGGGGRGDRRGGDMRCLRGVRLLVRGVRGLHCMRGVCVVRAVLLLVSALVVLVALSVLMRVLVVRLRMLTGRLVVVVVCLGILVVVWLLSLCARHEFHELASDDFAKITRLLLVLVAVAVAVEDTRYTFADLQGISKTNGLGTVSGSRSSSNQCGGNDDGSNSKNSGRTHLD